MTADVTEGRRNGLVENQENATNGEWWNDLSSQGKQLMSRLASTGHDVDRADPTKAEHTRQALWSPDSDAMAYVPGSTKDFSILILFFLFLQ